MYGSRMDEIESMIARLGPKLMRQANAPGSGSQREESRPKKTATTKGSLLITPEIGRAILEMEKLGKGSTEIGEHFRIHAENVRTYLRKMGVKANPERTKALRSSAYSGTKMSKA